MTLIFYDTEFTGLHQGTTIISIGLVADNGDYFYAEFNDFDRSQVNSWLEDNVLSNLMFRDYIDKNKMVVPKSMQVKNWMMCGNTKQVTRYLKEWLSKFDVVEMWSDCLPYDYVLFNELFDGSLNSPVPYIHFDICTLMKIKNIDPDIGRESFGDKYIQKNNHLNKILKHNSLWDAYVIKACYDKMEAEY